MAGACARCLFSLVVTSVLTCVRVPVVAGSGRAHTQPCDAPPVQHEGRVRALVEPGVARWRTRNHYCLPQPRYSGADRSSAFVVCVYEWCLRLGLERGSMVLLVFEPSLDFIIAYLACLRAGMVAVPTYPPGACCCAVVGGACVQHARVVLVVACYCQVLVPCRIVSKRIAVLAR